MCRYHNQPGIEIRPYDFGGLGGIYSIDPALPAFTATYKPIIDKLLDAGYKENQDLFGAPYDFRLAGDGLEQVSKCLHHKYSSAMATSLILAVTTHPASSYAS